MAERTNIATQMRAGDDDDNRSAEAIRQDIAAKRETISETVDKLGERIHESLDWREYIAEYPVAAIGVAAGVGFLVSGIFTGLLKHRPTPQERIMDAFAELSEDLTDRVSGIAGDVIKKKLVSGKTVKAAATAMVTKAVLDFAKQKATDLFKGDGSQRPGRYAGAQNVSASDRADFEANIHTETLSRSSMRTY